MMMMMMMMMSRLLLWRRMRMCKLVGWFFVGLVVPWVW
jgi:hypothetical protein